MSWPWKKKTASISRKEKSNYLKPGNVEVPLESYTGFITLEDKLKSSDERADRLEGEIEELKEKLSSAKADLDAKEGLVKHHAKAAEEAVNGREKADAEALTLKQQFEVVTLSKGKTEDHAAEVEAALKECVRETRILKEEHEKRIHVVVSSMKAEFDQMKHGLESRIAGLDGKLVQAAAENSALAKLLQERLNLIAEMREDNALLESRIAALNSQVESYEREIASLHYEFHVAAKELEIRTEEKKMSDRSADVANRHHIEATKKVAKLEGECQKLRGLIRKRLPGPAAVAQMKTEVERFDRDYSRRLSFEGFNRESEVYTQRILAMEEEIRTLKDALRNKISELRESESRLQSHIEKVEDVKGKQLELMADFLEMEKLPNASPCMESDVVSQDFFTAVKKLYEFALQMDRSALNGSVDELSSFVTAENPNSVKFVVALSNVLAKDDVASPDCIDKVALPEVNVDLECNSTEGLEWKLEKEMLTSDLIKSYEDLEATRTQLHVAEERLCDVECHLAAVVKANGLSETQVKCMTESYRALEARAALLETKVNEFRVKTDTLESEVNEFKVKTENLESALQIEREKCHEKASQEADVKAKQKQDKELLETAEKLAECQETILILGKELKAMQPHNEQRKSTEKILNNVASQEDRATERYVPSDGEPWTPRLRSPLSLRHLGSPSSSGFIKLFRGKNGY